jgi:hypothetical protein
MPRYILKRSNVSVKKKKPINYARRIFLVCCIPRLYLSCNLGRFLSWVHNFFGCHLADVDLGPGNILMMKFISCCIQNLEMCWHVAIPKCLGTWYEEGIPCLAFERMQKTSLGQKHR